MSKTIPIPRKRRTRQHVIAAQSANYVERFIIDEGHTAQRFEYDYGYDLMVFTYDEQGFAEEGSIYFQLKASETLSAGAKGYVFDLDIRDYNHWKAEPMPVILVLFDASKGVPTGSTFNVTLPGMSRASPNPGPKRCAFMSLCASR